MGLLEKIRQRGKSDSILKGAILGTGPLAELLAAGYRKCEGIELAACQPIEKAEAVLGTPGLQFVEIVAPAEERLRIAADCLSAGLFTSLDPVPDPKAIERLKTLAGKQDCPLRFRLYPLYYAPYREVKRLVDEDHLSRPISLKLLIRRGKGAEINEGHDPLQWLLENELGYLALSGWLMGDVRKVYAKQVKKDGKESPGSAVIMWKYADHHQFGYLQLDFSPGLHVRTLTEPIHRFLELTLLGGIILVTRGEGQLLRMPPVIVRGRSTTTAFELVEDDWRDVYTTLAQETYDHLVKKRPIVGTSEAAQSSLRLALAAMKSRDHGEEVLC
jgi:predicted dehydrogenase